MQTTVTINNDVISMKIPITIKRYRGKIWLMAPEQHTQPATTKPQTNASMVKALASAYHWQHLLETGKFATFKSVDPILPAELLLCLTHLALKSFSTGY